MGTIPTTTNKTLGDAEALINGSIMQVLDPILITFISSIPGVGTILKIWPLSAIFSWLVGMILQAFSVVLQQTGVKMIITIQTDAEKNAYMTAEGNLRQALLTGDPNAIKKAKADADAAFDSLIHYDGSHAVIG